MRWLATAHARAAADCPGETALRDRLDQHRDQLRAAVGADEFDALWAAHAAAPAAS